MTLSDVCLLALYAGGTWLLLYLEVTRLAMRRR